MLKVGIVPVTYAYVALMKKRFFSVNAGLRSATRDDFLKRLKRNGIPFGKSGA